MQRSFARARGILEDGELLLVPDPIEEVAADGFAGTLGRRG